MRIARVLLLSLVASQATAHYVHRKDPAKNEEQKLSEDGSEDDFVKRAASVRYVTIRKPYTVTVPITKTITKYLDKPASRITATIVNRQTVTKATTAPAVTVTQNSFLTRTISASNTLDDAAATFTTTLTQEYTSSVTIISTSLLVSTEIIHSVDTVTIGSSVAPLPAVERETITQYITETGWSTQSPVTITDTLWKTLSLLSEATASTETTLYTVTITASASADIQTATLTASASIEIQTTTVTAFASADVQTVTSTVTQVTTSQGSTYTQVETATITETSSSPPKTKSEVVTQSETATQTLTFLSTVYQTSLATEFVERSFTQTEIATETVTLLSTIYQSSSTTNFIDPSFSQTESQTATNTETTGSSASSETFATSTAAEVSSSSTTESATVPTCYIIQNALASLFIDADPFATWITARSPVAESRQIWYIYGSIDPPSQASYILNTRTLAWMTIDTGARTPYGARSRSTFSVFTIQQRNPGQYPGYFSIQSNPYPGNSLQLHADEMQSIAHIYLDAEDPEMTPLTIQTRKYWMFIPTGCPPGFAPPTTSTIEIRATEF